MEILQKHDHYDHLLQVRRAPEILQKHNHHDHIANVINPHQRCGCSNSPFARKDTFLYCRVQKWISGNGNGVYPQDVREFQGLEKYFEDVREDEKHIPDLLESRMRPTDPVKKSYGGFWWKWFNLHSKSKKSRFQLFGFRKSKASPPEANASLLAGRFPSIARPNIWKMWVLARRTLTL